jgi:3-hydroxybutyryl-CoA dehydrogenase
VAALNKSTVVGVVGAGTMGAGIAQVAAAAGHQVLLYDAADGAVENGLARTNQGLDRQVERRKMSAETRTAIMSRIQACGELSDLAPAGLVIEAVIEDLEIKRKILSQLQDLCAPDAVMASNTSSISITAIGAALKRPEQLVGMHFFNPAPVMKLVEVISGLATCRDLAKDIGDTATAWGKVAVQAKSTPGFIVNRVARPFYAEALRILQEGGADVVTIDTVMRESGGFRMGPFELMDLIGNDVNYAVTRSVFEAFYQDPRYKPSLIQLEQVLAGRLGQKSGRGYYEYGENIRGPDPAPSPVGPRPAEIHVRGALGPTKVLIERAQSRGIKVLLQPGGETAIEIDGVLLLPCDGRTATQHSAELRHQDVVVFDLCLDYHDSSRICLAMADQSDNMVLSVACGFFQALGMEVSVIDDIPGLILTRTVCMLANEGADVVNQQVCNADAVDRAMLHGLNYPRGPLAWADRLGDARVVSVLENLYTYYGEDRYRVSPFLRRRHYAGKPVNE